MMIFSQISEEHLFSASVFLALCLVFLVARHFAARRAKSDPRSLFAHETLQEALSQDEAFYLKTLDGEGSAEFQARLQGIDSRGLAMLVREESLPGRSGQTVEANFTLATPEGPKFYRFDSKIVKATGSAPEFDLILQMPSFLQVEKKRHFARIKPDQDSIRKIALWPLDQNRPLPAGSSEMAKAPVLWMQGSAPLVAQVENISGSGLGLRLAQEAFTAISPQIRRGDGVLCAIEFSLPDRPDSSMSFWFTAEAMNIRPEQDGAKVIGLEFTNWALAEDDSDILRWTYSSPYRGARPILDLVKHEEEKQWRKFK